MQLLAVRAGPNVDHENEPNYTRFFAEPNLKSRSILSKPTTPSVAVARPGGYLTATLVAGLLAVAVVLSLALIPDEHDHRAQSTLSNGKPDLPATADKPSSSIALNVSDAGHVTFSRHVAPIVFRHCAGCHRPDGSAPFSLLTYRDIKKRGRQIAELTQKRIMPPWLPESSDVELMGDPSLTEQQIATIHQWVEQGAAEGDPRDLPEAPNWSDSWQLGEPDLIVRLPRAYTLQAEGTDVWRKFVLPAETSKTRFIRAVELRPGNKKIVHHAIVKVDGAGNARRRDLLDPAPGFDGMELIDDVVNPDGHFLSWTPGMTPFEGFPGLAWRLHPGMDLVLEVHMVPSGKPEEVQPTIGLYFADRPPDRYPFEILLHSEEIDIPPGTADYHVSDSYVLPVEVEILGVHPHAHQIGKRMVAYATLPDGSRKSLLSIPQWDFNWQNVYRYARPIVLPEGTTLTMEFSYDNSSTNPRNPHQPPQRIQYGFRTSDEMAQLSVQVLPRTESDRAKLAEHFRSQELKATIKRNELLLRRSPDDVGLHVELGKARFVLGEIEDALARLERAVELDPNNCEARYYLGRVHMFRGDLDAAIQAFEAALDQKPPYEPARNELGLILMQKGRHQDAVAQFQEALRIRPSDAVLRNNLGIALFNLGEKREAVDQFRQALDADPNYGPASENLRKTAPLINENP